MNSVEIRARIEKLSQHPNARTVYGASTHAWAFKPPMAEAQLAAFETRRRVSLPEQYRRWLHEVASSGAGPGHGLFEPGRWSLGRTPDGEWTGKQYGPLATPFPYAVAAEPRRGTLPGAMPVCDFGCGSVGVLVTAGSERGRIWIDHRADSRLVQEDGLDFEGWIEGWLTESERAAESPWTPPVKHPNAPDRTVPASAVVPEEELATFVTEMVARVRADGKVSFGKIGALVRRPGQSPTFDQGPALRAALTGAALPDVGVITKLLAYIVAAPPWTAIEVPGLFRAWVREVTRTPARDYLGRTMWVGDEGRFLTVATTFKL